MVGKHAKPVSATLDEETREVEEEPTHDQVKEQADRSSNSLSVLVIISRLTGFLRTSMQAWALGAAGLASAYTVANTLPNVLYEFVVGGMLITAFLPVYVHVRQSLGRPGAYEYVSNLLSIVTIIMVGATILSFIFAVPIIWTQSAGADAAFDSELAVWFFRWFCCEIVLYALSSIFSGVLNAERDYFWSSVAPIFNNVVTIASFVIYGILVQYQGVPWNQAVIVLAVGNPLGVAIQVFCQLPALLKRGVRLRLRVNLHDPALKETLKIGLPTIIGTLASTPTAAVTSSCALSVTAAGASISYYARVWYVLPYSVFAIPLTTTLFTELSNSFLAHDMHAFKDFFNDGIRKILFTLMPCTLFLIVFSEPLIAVFASGQFTMEAARQTAEYLSFLALALPFYSLASHLQKACSSMMAMGFYTASVCVASAVQIVVCIVCTPIWGLYVVPVTSALFYITVDAMTLLYIRSKIGAFGLRSIMLSFLRSMGFGLAGSVVGAGILLALETFVGPCEGIARGLLYVFAGGIPALIVCYGGAYVLGLSEAPFFDAIFGRILPKRGRIGKHSRSTR